MAVENVGDRVPFPLPPFTHRLSAFHDGPPLYLSLDFRHGTKEVLVILSPPRRQTEPAV